MVTRNKLNVLVNFKPCKMQLQSNRENHEHQKYFWNVWETKLQTILNIN